MLSSLQFDPAVFAHSDTHAFWLDASMTFLGCNDAVANFWQLDSTSDYSGKDHNFLKRRFHELYPKSPFEINVATCDSFRQNNLSVLQYGVARMGFLDRPLIMNETRIYFETQLIPLHDHSNQIRGILGLCREITPSAHSGAIQQWMTDWLTARAQQHHTVLTRRELQVVKSTMLGLTAATVAQRLGLSTRTIEAHLDSAIVKLQLDHGISELRLLVAEYLGVSELFSGLLPR